MFFIQRATNIRESEENRCVHRHPHRRRDPSFPHLHFLQRSSSARNHLRALDRLWNRYHPSHHDGLRATGERHYAETSKGPQERNARLSEVSGGTLISSLCRDHEIALYKSKFLDRCEKYNPLIIVSYTFNSKSTRLFASSVLCAKDGHRRITKMGVRMPGDLETDFIEDENDSKGRTLNGLWRWIIF